MTAIHRTGRKGGLVTETPTPPDPFHKEAYRLVQGHYLNTKQRTGNFRGATRAEVKAQIDAAEERYQASKQRLINLVQIGLRHDV